jgi:hypothetical protein
MPITVTSVGNLKSCRSATVQEIVTPQVGLRGLRNRCRIAKLYVACDSNSCHLEEICQQDHSALSGISVQEKQSASSLKMKQ